MRAQADIHFVEERAVFSAYAPSIMSRQAAAGCSSILWKITGWIKRLVDWVTGTPSPTQTLLPPPPPVYGCSTLFRRDPVAIRNSRQASGEYRSINAEKMAALKYPLRVRPARHTGLPSALNGLLSEAVSFDSSPTAARDIISKWLFDDLTCKALFGAPAAVTRQQLTFKGVVRFRHRPGFGQEKMDRRPNGKTEIWVDGTFQQWHQNPDGEKKWPVFGGQVIVHLAAGDRRVSVTSSYFPIPAETRFTSRISPERAQSAAQWALAGYLKGAAAVSFYAHLLRPWLKEPAAKKVAPWQRLHRRAAQQLLSFALPETEGRKKAQPPDGQKELLAQLRSAAAKRKWLDLPPWQVRVAPYEGKDLFIFPFAGQYHLAYRIELSSPAAHQYWRVFVDATDGAALGQPESLVTHDVSIYRTSGDVPGLKSSDAASSPPQLNNSIQDFTTLDKYSGEATVTANIAAIGETAAGVDFEAVNVAYHAKKIYDHFTGVCEVDPNQLGSYTYTDENGAAVTVQPGLKIIVGKGGDELDMGFVYAQDQHPKLVTFQTDGGNGLATQVEDGISRKVHTPSLDPELIYHEMAHGLMWLINRAPFDGQNTSVPFGRALAEGYANYFARSLAERQDAASNLWARAAYRRDDGPGADDRGWSTRWDLARTDRIPGADLLPAPNLYPNNQTAGYPVYDVGMIWARALWAIRQVVGADQADSLALKAFAYAHGWVSNFETVAEGLIDTARRLNMSAVQIQAMMDVFAERNILAERGVQALAMVEAAGGQPRRLLVGTDAGVMASTDEGANWVDWGPLVGEGKSRGVVALVADGQRVYAATEDGVYRRDSGQGNWTELAGWPEGLVPFCLLVADGKPYVGASHGVYQFDGNWKPWGEKKGAQLDGLAWRMADVALQPANQTKVRIRCVATVAGAMAREDSSPNRSWENPQWMNGVLATAMAALGDTLYVGTLKDGIYQQIPTRDPSNSFTIWDQWRRFDDAGTFDNKAVLCLVALPDGQMYVGTTSGLFIRALHQGNWQWEQPADLTKATVTQILPIGNNQLMAGTAHHGLWLRKPEGQWVPLNIGL